MLSGELLHCYDISMSYVVRKWAVVLARPLLTEGRWKFTGSGNTFSPLQRDKLVDMARGMLKAYQTQHPFASLDDFYRDNSLDLRKLAANLQQESQNPVYVTAEHHPVIRAIAEYEVLDLVQVQACLDEAEEFVFAGESDAKPEADHYNWLLRGRSHIPVNPDRPDYSLEFRSEWTQGPGQPSYRSLGDVSLTATTLELSCQSRERLTAGRSLLEDLLQDVVVHRGDTYSDIIAERNDAPQASAGPRLAEIDPAARQVEIELLARQAEQWLDTPIPSLGPRTPREASQTPEGRAQL